MRTPRKMVPAVTPVRHTAEEFSKRYEALCKETGFQIAFEPRWAKSQDTGDYRLVIIATIVPMVQNA